ncbi:hypothetical protein MPSEU_000522800 [Mayamaea pseudoterrestris]|nr:hypothetical protein MPSEU_000522800 [Mayamaea pseudoterrestris]
MQAYILFFTLLGASVDAFVGPLPAALTTNIRSPLPSSSARSFNIDPIVLQDLHESFYNAIGSISLADAVDAAADAVPAAAAATDGNGWFGFLTGPTETLLQGIHSVLVGVGVSGNAWGVSIIILTLFIKALTFPLTKTQLESTNKMQAMQPEIKKIQAKYQSNPEVMNQKVAEFYQSNEINPLAGCIPSLVQIPVFIGLYRSVLNLAKENKLDEPFLWLPNLEGPTYGADPAHGSDWILKGWTDGTPSLGWESTIAFLILPVFLVISQFASMQLMQPKTDDPNAPQSNAVLKLLPLMIGWFSLNVPAALCLYWVVNNIVTTGTSLLIRNSIKTTPVEAAGSGSVATTTSIFAPPRERPSGFGDAATRRSASDDFKPITDVTPITSSAATDAEIVVDGESKGASDSSESASATKKRNGKKKRKKTN